MQKAAARAHPSWPAGTARQLPRAAGHGQLQPRYLARTAQRPTRRVVFPSATQAAAPYIPTATTAACTANTKAKAVFSGITAFRLPEILNQ